MAKNFNKKLSPLVVPSADALNFDTFNDYYYRLLNIAISTIKWNNLPLEIDHRFLELTLFEKGFCLFFKEDLIDKYAALPCMINGELNIYRIPFLRRAYAVNGYQKDRDAYNSVIIFDNYARVLPINTLELYARRLTEVERAIDVNIKSTKTPLIIICDESQVLTMKNTIKKYDENVPFIFGKPTLDESKIEVLNTKSELISEKLVSLKNEYWAEAMQFLGVEVQTNEKKERLISAEATGSLGNIAAHRFTRISARMDACKKINEMFGLNISCEFREEMNVDMRLPVREKGEDEFEQIYDDNTMDDNREL